MERTGLALVKLVYLVLCIHEYKARLKALSWHAGPFYRHPDLEHILSTSARFVLRWVNGWTEKWVCKHRGRCADASREAPVLGHGALLRAFG